MHRKANIPVYVVSDEGDVEEEGEELSGDEEEGVEEDVQDVLWEDERVEAVALVYRVLVVRLQLVERDDLWKISICFVCMNDSRGQRDTHCFRVYNLCDYYR